MKSLTWLCQSITKETNFVLRNISLCETDCLVRTYFTLFIGQKRTKHFASLLSGLFG